jgi:ABC-2 type transport system permease protein
VNNTPHPTSYLKALLQADFIVLLKNKRALIASLIVPLYMLFVTNIHKNGQTGHSVLGSPVFLVVLAITIGILSTSILSYALTVARDRERGVFQRLRVTPAPVWTIMVSRLLVQTAANLIIAVVVLAVGEHVHQFSLSTGEYASALLVATLAGAVFLSIGQALVGLVKSATLVNSIGSLLYVALLLSGLLGPSGALGTTFENISKWTPVGTVIAVFQGTLHQTTWDSHAWLSLLACFGYILVFSAIGIKWFKWDAQ